MTSSYLKTDEGKLKKLFSKSWQIHFPVPNYNTAMFYFSHKFNILYSKVNKLIKMEPFSNLSYSRKPLLIDNKPEL